MSITLRSDSGLAAGAITEAGLGLASFTDASGNSIVVTAIADSNSNLKLISWKVPPTGNSVSRLSDSGTQAGQSSLVDMAASTQNRVITGVRASDGNLRLIAWQIHLADGSIHRLTDSGNHIGAVSMVAMSPSPEGNGNVLVALKNSSGNLMVENWGFDGNGALARHGDVTAGAIGGVAVGPMSGGRAWTAVIDGSGDLKVIIWRVGAGGGLTRAGDSGTHAGTAKQVSGVAMGDFLITALRDGGNNLLLISWKISADGNAVTRVSDTSHQAGGADTISCCALAVNDPSRLGKVIIALRAREFTLELIAWNVSASGAVQRAESFSDRPGTFDMGKIAPGAPGTFVTAIRESPDKRLKLVAWQILDGSATAVLPNNVVLYLG